MSSSTYGGYAIMALGVAGMVYAGVMLSQTGNGRPADATVARGDDAATDLQTATAGAGDAASGDTALAGSGGLTFEIGGVDDGDLGEAEATQPGGLAAAPGRPSDPSQDGKPAAGLGASATGLLAVAPQPSTAEPATRQPVAPQTASQAPTLGTGSQTALQSTAPFDPDLGPDADAPASLGAVGGASLGAGVPAPGGQAGTVAAITPDRETSGIRPEPTEAVIDALDPDPIMAAAIRRARSTLPDLLDKMMTPPPGTSGYSLKVAVPTQSAFEQMWVDNCLPEGRRLLCQAANDGVETGLRIGDPYRVNTDMIADWMYLEGEGIHGGYTLRLMLQDMEPSQADALRSRLRPLPG
ncbi:MAG: DUF2314 domain-containing protein [Pseudomonadota bacterium]